MSVGLISGDAEASSASYDSFALVGSLQDTLNMLITNADAFAEANKSYLEMHYNNVEDSATRIDNEAHQKRWKFEPKLTTHVLGYFSTYCTE